MNSILHRLARMFSLNTIRSLRLAKGWKQRELAARAGVSQKDISSYERGEQLPALPAALAIGIALGRRVEEMFFELFEAACHNVGASAQPTYVPDPQ